MESLGTAFARAAVWVTGAPASTAQIPLVIGAAAAMLLLVRMALRRRLSVPDILAARPAVERDAATVTGRISAGTHDDKESAVLLCEDRRSPASEAFRVLRTRLLLMAQEGKLRHVLITSAGPGEGKTMISANVAVAAAHAGRKVLLVDADLPRPRLCSAFHVANDPGLVQLLHENGAVTEEVLRRFCQSTSVPNLTVLPAGSPAGGAAELFAGARMLQIVAAFGAAYDLVVYDSPPVLSVADPTVLAGHVDGILLVVRVGEYPRDAIQQAHRELAAVHAKVIGVVLNGVESGSQGSYYGHYRYAYHD
ncbi:MAG: CpsD/CapB family tyrosine-protein kinase [Candidatus Binatia bacterium]